MAHSEADWERAEGIVAPRCEAAVSKFLDFCKSMPGRAIKWESAQSPWSFVVTYDDGKWVMENVEDEIADIPELFEDDDLTSREGVEHVILAALVTLGTEIALGDVPETTLEAFLGDMEEAVPFS